MGGRRGIEEERERTQTNRRGKRTSRWGDQEKGWREVCGVVEAVDR